MEILIVDDHAGVRRLIRELLVDSLPQGAGRQPVIIECASGEEAIASIAAARPALVTVDLRMPGMGGLECVRQMRARVPLACIVVVTQFGNASLHERARRAGADAVVVKDELSRLQELTRTYLTRR